MSESLYPIAILAGGLATRLRPATDTIPKALLDVNGTPFIGHQLRLFRSRGISRVVVCAGHLGEAIREYVGDGSGFGLAVTYSFDGQTLLGTGGAIKNALALLGPSFFVVYGDSYLPCDYRAAQEAFERSGRLALMTVYRNDGRWDRSNVQLEEGRLVAYDKRRQTAAMRHIDYGLGVFRRTAFDAVSEGQPYDLATLYQDLLARGELAAHEVAERFYEIGSFEGLAETRRLLGGGEPMSFAQDYLREVGQIVERLDVEAIERAVALLAETRDRGGRLFILGVGGSAANASHAVNDFRKIVGLEAYAPTDNVSELTARTNDEGWASTFEAWLRVSRLRAADLVLVLSVGGGDLEKNVSPNLVAALTYAKQVDARVIGIVGRNGGYTAKVADACVIVPTVNPARVTPHSEAFQAVIWHLLVSHPSLKMAATKWESVR